MALVTNTTVAPALNGQAVKCTLSGAEAITYLSTIVAGQACTLSSSGKTGTVYSVDYDGLSFLIRPATDTARFDSSTTPGQLAVNDTVSILIV